jgi:peptide/nickel transport system permease protein
MVRFLIRRIFLGLFVLWVVSMAVFYLFFGLNSSGPNAVASRICGKQCTPQQINAVN